MASSVIRRVCSRAPAFLPKTLTLLPHPASSSSVILPKVCLKSSSIGSCRMISTSRILQKETITIHLHMPDGEKVTTKAKIGDSILDVIVENDIDIDGYGACEGTLACSTCHLIFTPEQFKSLPDQATDEELDMLDLAFSLTDTSRLGCQILLTKDMDGWNIKVPSGIADARDV
ncbi:hypothetical protein CAPTEDRAFT_226250 [Capitella teleta]|uniref:2Fe-2S ferredoxin-type domain-containing protein n=1 Tax=Capitella teleta TaxID=283909 RepID=R7TWN5_CAPTE|nr:hypothetical protein CAPTEDRAFT_226250 [Capitella teleta]|eukprot:ELT95390.1 hypothetical protein CAPTEDRAFT_226250 [Capitella teleta]